MATSAPSELFGQSGPRNRVGCGPRQPLRVGKLDIILSSGRRKTHQMATTTLAPPAVTIAPFPSAAVEARLRDELVEAVKIEASIRGMALPAAPADIVKVSVRVDSLVVVSILCAVEPIVGFELPESVVRAGGYTSVESALGQLLPRLEKEWMKKKGAKS
jgi:hypothetical protein